MNLKVTCDPVLAELIELDRALALSKETSGETIGSLWRKIAEGTNRLQALLDGRDPDEEMMDDLADQGFKYGEPNDDDYGAED